MASSDAADSVVYDCVTVSRDPTVKVTRTADGDVSIVGSSEGVTVPSQAVPALCRVLDAFEATPTGGGLVGVGGFMHDDGEGQAHVGVEMGRECPDCEDGELRDGLGGTECPDCGYSDDHHTDEGGR